MSAPINFTIDDNMTPDIEGLKRNLRRTIKYGKIAETALKNIEEVGYHNGRVRVIESIQHGWQSNVVTHDLKKTRPVVRSESLPLSDLQVALEDAGTSTHGGSKFRVADIMLNGTFMVSPKKAEPHFDYQSVVIGKVRFLKTGYSADFGYGYEIVKLYAEFRNLSKYVQDSLKEMSRKLAESLVLNEGLRTYYALDTEMNLREWLVSEGHTQRLMKDLVDQAKILDVEGA